MKSISKMKTTRKLLMLCLFGMVSIGANAYDFVVDGIYYAISGDADVSVTYNEWWNEGSYSGIVNIPSTVEYGGKSYNVTKIGDQAFRRSEITYVAIPKGITEICQAAFYESTGLKSITIPSTVKTIGNSAFMNCKDLSSVKLPEGLQYIKQQAFAGTKITSIGIPESVIEIGNCAFYGCASLNEVNIPENITTIALGLFGYCTSLTSIDIPNRVTSIGIEAFKGCTSLTSVFLPAKVEFIDGAAFEECRELRTIHIPSGVTTIAWNAFKGCSRLTSVVLPNDLKVIDTNVFEGCDSLHSVVFPESLTKIGKMAFSGCTMLDSISLPRSLTSIGDEAFFGCTRLSCIHCYATTPPAIGRNSFSYTFNYYETEEYYEEYIDENGETQRDYYSWEVTKSAPTVLHVLTGCSETYSQNEYWGKFSIVDDIEVGRVTRIELDADVYWVEVGGVGQAIAKVYPEDAFSKEIAWSCDDPSKLLVDYKGQFVGLDEGEVTLTATAKDGSGVSASAKVHVTEGAQGPEPGPKCADPVITYENGRLSIQCETEGATCHYSTDAATLSAKFFSPYSEGSDLFGNIQVTVYAFAMLDGYTPSGTVSKTVSLPVGVVHTETITEYVEKWDTAYIEMHDTTFVNVEVHDTTFVNVVVHDTTFVDVPYEVLVHDTTFVNVEVHDTTYVDVPYEVIINDTVWVSTQEMLPTPTILSNDNVVEIVSSREDAVIFYTLDGTEPELYSAKLYTSPFEITSNCTVKAIAVLVSEIVSADIVDGIKQHKLNVVWRRYIRSDGVETETPSQGVNIVITKYDNGLQTVSKYVSKGGS